jgi:hypothetical protein
MESKELCTQQPAIRPYTEADESERISMKAMVVLTYLY